MSDFDFKKHIKNFSDLLEDDGSLKSFDESHVIALSYRRGEWIKEIEYFDSPTIELSVEMTVDEPPYILDIAFYSCDEIVMDSFNYDNWISQITFREEERGYFLDGVTPLPPWIYVQIGTAETTYSEHGTITPKTAFSSFRCFKIEVLGKRDVTSESYAYLGDKHE
jgi:hypothetical protein